MEKMRGRGGSVKKETKICRSIDEVNRQRAAASEIRELLGVGELMLSFKMRGESPTQRLPSVTERSANLRFFGSDPFSAH